MRNLKPKSNIFEGFKMNIMVEIFTGKDTSNFINLIAQLRIKHFREYPYLYEGNMELEKQYLQAYAADVRSIFVIAKVNDEITEVSTGIPLVSSSVLLKDAETIFRENGLEPNEYYYYGEVIILPEHRGLEILVKMLAAQNKKVREWGYKYITGLTVIRGEKHPLKPDDYKSPDKLGHYFGYNKSGFTIKYSWPTIQKDGHVKNMSNALEFWLKKL